MNSLSLAENYWSDRIRKQAFLSYVVDLFDTDLSAWDKAGFWDEAYRPFSFFENQVVVANACVYSIETVVLGETRRVAQVSAVGTRQEYRGRGLAGELLALALEWARENHDFSILYATPESYGLYRKFGFSSRSERAGRILVEGTSPKPGLERIDPGDNDNLARVYDIVIHRAPVSDIFGPLNPRLFMFAVMNRFRRDTYYIPSLDCIVLYRRERDRVLIFDIAAKQTPIFDRVYPFITQPTDRMVDLQFVPDKIAPGITLWTTVPDNGLHVDNRFPLKDKTFAIPGTTEA